MKRETKNTLRYSTEKKVSSFLEYFFNTFKVIIDNRFITSSIIIVFFLLILAKGITFIDPDYGWYLKTGQLFLKGIIPRQDPFSYTMPSFPFVSHEWFTLLIIAFLEKNFGYSSLSFLFVGLMLLTLYISVQTSRVKNKWKIIPIFGLLSMFYVFGVVRAQVTSWFFLSLLVYIFYSDRKKFIYAIPLLFLIWANMHGSFVIGLVALGILSAVKMYESKKMIKREIVIFFLSIIATLANPYGIGIWREAVMTVTDAYLQSNIAEWLPLIFMFDFTVWFYLVFSVFFVFKYRNKLRTGQLIIYLLFLIMSLKSRRHYALWMIVSVPLTLESIVLLEKESIEYKFGKKRYQKFMSISTVILMLCMISYGVFIIRKIQISEQPHEAITYLQNNPTEGNVFNNYNWGGYLIWKLPEKKTFIDGRMPIWRRSNSPGSESAYAMKDYLEITQGKINYKDDFKKYNIDTVLWPSRLNNKKSGFVEILYQVLNRNLDNRDFLSDLKDDGWKVVYEDDISVIYRKPQ